MRGGRIALTFFAGFAIPLLMLADLTLACDPEACVGLSNDNPEWAHVNYPYGLELSYWDYGPGEYAFYEWWCLELSPYVFDLEYFEYYWHNAPPSGWVYYFPTVGVYHPGVFVGNGRNMEESTTSAQAIRIVYAVQVSLSASTTNLGVHGERVPITLSASAPSSGQEDCKVRLSLGCQTWHWASIYASQYGGEPLIEGNGYKEWDLDQKPDTVWIEGESASSVDGVEVWIQYMDPQGNYHVPLHPMGVSDLLFTVYQVELVPSTTGPAPNGPYLDQPGDVCLNAQSQYKTTLWTAYVWPQGTASVARILGCGYTATDITLAPVGSANLSALTDGQQFWVTGDYETGYYGLQLEHNAVDAYDWPYGRAFQFRFENTWSVANSIGSVDGTSSEPSFSKECGWVKAPRTNAPGPNPGGAELTRIYAYDVATEPAGVYSGKVKATAGVDVLTQGTITIYACTKPAAPQTVSFSFRLFGGLVSISESATSGDTHYYKCGAKGVMKIDIANITPYPGPWISEGVPRTHEDVWYWPGGTKQFSNNLTQSISDIQRTWQVGSSSNTFSVTIAVGSDAENFDEDHWYLHAYNSWVPEDTQTINAVNVNPDGGYEITN
jgi:hypothetical protein